jgi:hypothetical protein
MNTKKDKIELLKAIRAGHVKVEEIPENPIVISKPGEVFYGIMIMTDIDEAKGKNSVVFVGEAKHMLKRMETEIKELTEQYRKEDENIAQ